MSGLLGAEQLQKLWMHVALNSMQVRCTVFLQIHFASIFGDGYLIQSIVLSEWRIALREQDC